ncbi:MAG: PglZ domain-containing protein [Blastocatellia bacterium]
MISEPQDIQSWVLTKLEAIKEQPYVLVRDDLRLLPDTDSMIHNYGRENGYTVLVAATNLVFRELYEHAVADHDTKKIMVIDRAPRSRRLRPSVTKAPPPFYPDLLARVPENARIALDLRQYLKEKTGDPNWPQETNEPRYARLIVRHLAGVLRAYRNLRANDRARFTDKDFKEIVAFSSLGVAEAAFKKLNPKDYWRIGLLSHEALEELDHLAPEITKPIKDALQKAEAPFCWFGSYDSETVIQAFYLSLIISQHLENWRLLLANIDPRLAALTGIKSDVLSKSAPQLVELDPAQANRDLETIEGDLNPDSLQLLLLDQINIGEPKGFTAALEKEKYSILFRSLALLMALDNLVSTQPAGSEHQKISTVLFPEKDVGKGSFVDTRVSVHWSHLKEAYLLAGSILPLRDELASVVKNLKVKKTEQLNFKLFRELWNKKRINRLEYYLSAFERLVESGDFLPRTEDDLPSAFISALSRIRQRVKQISEDVYRLIDEVNKRFQEMVAAQYPSWILTDGEVRLTSQFLRRCVRPHWDPETEKAVVFIFDGMRYDVWDELLRPMMEDRLEIIEDLPASSLLPSETEISRWALAAGTEPQNFWPRKAENVHLKEALGHLFNYRGEVEVVDPEGSGTGETVRYRAGNLDYYIFEFCDKELHGIQMRELSDGRIVPKRPLSYVYQQHLKNIIDTEVMAIVRRLIPGTKVFITADHGFGRVGRDAIWFSEAALNEKADCSYLNCWLRVPLEKANLPAKALDNVISFTPEQLHTPKEETRTIRQSGNVFHKEYKAIVFPKVGYSFSRQGAPYRPDAYTHGGISIQELMIPMIALRVRARDEGLLTLDPINGPSEVVEGEEIVFSVRMNPTKDGNAREVEIRVEVEATYSRNPERFSLPKQVLYLPSQHPEILYRFTPDTEEATESEQRQGVMTRTFTVAVSYREGTRMVRKSQTHQFAIRLKSEKVIRRLGNLGNILGLTPKSMR